MKDRTLAHVKVNPLRPGALIRTRFQAPHGVHKDVVRSVERDKETGETWVSGKGWRFLESQVEVIRPPV
jgi:hypothetical protein